ncbi:MAG: hypothetical protein AAB853_02875 [Patescibacteria group bacterium]
MFRTHFTILCVLAGLLLPFAALSQYTPPGNPFLGGDEPCEDDFLIPTLGSGEVRVQPCPSGGTGGTGNTGGGNGGGGGGGGGGRRLTGERTLKARRLVPATAPVPLPVTPLPVEEEPVRMKPVWDPLRRPRIRRTIPGAPLAPITQPAAPVHAAAPLPETGSVLPLFMALMGSSSFCVLRKRLSSSL